MTRFESANSSTCEDYPLIKKNLYRVLEYGWKTCTPTDKLDKTSRNFISHEAMDKVKVQTECLPKMHVFYLQKCREKDEETLKLS